MNIALNYWGILLAAVASMVIGAVWYARPVFGSTWAKLAGIKMDGKPSFKNMAPLIGIQFAASLITAYIFAHFVFFVHYYTAANWIKDGIDTALWAWLGFTACRLLTHDLFEGRRKKLTILNVAFELVVLVAMGTIIGWMHP